MAHNTDSANAAKLLDSFTDNFETNGVLLETINTQLFDGQYTPKTGGVVSVMRPHMGRVSKTSDGDLTSETQSDFIAGKVTGEIQDRYTAWTTWNAYQEAIKLNRLDKFLDELSMQLLIDFEVDLFTYMRNNSGFSYGTPGTVADSFMDVAGAGGYLKSVGAKGEMYYVVPPFSMLNFAAAQSGLNAADGLVKTAWQKAQIKDLGAMMLIASNSLSTRTASAASDRAGTLSATPIATYTGAKDTMEQTLSVAGLNGGATFTLLAGETLEFTGARYVIHPRTKQIVLDETGTPLQWRCTNVADVELTSGAGDIVVCNAAIEEASPNNAYNNISANLASGDVFNVLGTTGAIYQPHLAYTKNAFTATFMKIPKLPQSISAGTTTKRGVSIRVSIGGDFITDKSQIRFDMHPIFAPLNQQWSVQGYGK
jgi:hypothetical protein